MKKQRNGHFESQVKLLQYFLVIPMIAIALFFTIYWIQDSMVTQLDRSHRYTLQNAADSFDKTFSRVKKLLESPYTDKTLFNSITAEPVNQLENTTIVPTLLLNNILYYEKNVSSACLWSGITQTLYYKRMPPSTGVNAQNLTVENIMQSEWYQKAISSSEAVIMPASENELFTNSGLTIMFAQRLRNVLKNKDIGVVRLDLNMQSIFPEWKSLAGGSDIFAVLDHAGQLVFSSNDTLYNKYPRLLVTTPSALSQQYKVNDLMAQDSKFTFLYLTPKSDIKLLLLLYGLPFLVVIVCVFYSSMFISWSARKISKPIQALKKSMIQGQQKDLTARCAPLDGEMGELSDAFNSLMERTQELVFEVAENEHEKSRLSYEVLQSKVNPHFLYNTLNAVRFKAELKGAKDIATALESLASLLRFSIKCTDELIPFEDELTQLENYIQIMRVRYGDDIDINYDIDDACYEYRSLKFLIQPAVENCYIHAFQKVDDRPKMITVRVACPEDSDNIIVEIEDNGNGMTDEQLFNILNNNDEKAKTMFVGIGIGNVRGRIKALFGNDYDLAITSVPNSFTKVRAVIPKIKL